MSSTIHYPEIPVPAIVSPVPIGSLSPASSADQHCNPAPAPAKRDPLAWIGRWYGHVAEMSVYK